MVSGPPDFVTVLPVAAVVTWVGSSLLAAIAIRWLARRRRAADVALRPTAVSCAIGQVAVLGLAAAVLVTTGGLPDGDLAGPLGLLLLAIYTVPLAFVAAGVGVVTVRRSVTERTRVLGATAGVVFAVAHLLAIPTTWLVFVLLAHL